MFQSFIKLSQYRIIFILEDDWILAIDSNSELTCPLKQYLKCETLGAEILTLTTQDECSNWCPTKTTVSFSESAQENNAIGCQWDGSTCSVCTTSHKLITSSATNHYAGLCLPNLDFIYTSDLWHAPIETYSELGGLSAEHPGTTGGNKLYRSYVDNVLGGITHVRIEMNNKKIDVAVAVALSGRYTLQELVTNPGGSEASPKGDGNVLANHRSNIGSVFGFKGTSDKICTNMGFNHLQSGGDKDGSTGWHSMSQNGARARIGVYKSDTFPCDTMNKAEGIGLDSEHSRPVGASGEGGRIGSGSVSTNSVSIFSKAKVYVAHKFPATRILRKDVYQQFGDANQSLKQDVLSQIHPSMVRE